jgi:lipopolysaccharide/colanic/teichoic acid biosynthesis glycosyltransferase
VAVSVAVLLVLAPLLAAIALAIAVTMGWPILHAQRRTGLGGRPFVLRKFRTMTCACGDDGRLLPDADRLTPLGRVLRATSLDELPELLHVVAGTMSLVGPRPLPTIYLARYSAHQARRLEVKPGVTGVAQVLGRNALPWQRRFTLDVWYVDHRSFALDMCVLRRTVGVVLGRRGISHPGHATMHEFAGTGR